MQPFWRTEPLSPAELELIDALGAAHHQSTFRQNPSTIALQCAAQGSGDLCKAVAVALMTLGGKHGPIEQTYAFLNRPHQQLEATVDAILKRGDKVPGWGSSFVETGQGDPTWKPMDAVLIRNFEEQSWRLPVVTQVLHDRGVLVLPNPSAYTAITAIILGMPRHLSPYLLIMSRLSAWAEVFLNELKGH